MGDSTVSEKEAIVRFFAAVWPTLNLELVSVLVENGFVEVAAACLHAPDEATVFAGLGIVARLFEIDAGVTIAHMEGDDVERIGELRGVQAVEQQAIAVALFESLAALC
jgi:hypothetical protein